ncbi:Lsr2 family protein [Actinoplanes sp. NPDC026623]|uniref:histone-like nucleoid-structuring protein Lsr2 n=1 Tax=Actinoplanes sp. NPDC026623 TaxID=3155610 RepID=UPI0033EA7794
MATRVQRTVVDDLDPSIEQGVDTYRFALEGVEYEIDLADHNLERLRAALYPFIAAGRRLPKSKTGKAATGEKASTIRQWWHDHEVDLGLPAYNARGVIPNQVKAAFRDTGQP